MVKSIYPQRRSEIIQAALALIQEEGFSNLTMKKVSERVGFSEAAIYRYFPTKADLTIALVQFFRDAFVLPLRQFVEAGELKGFDLVEEIWHHNMDIELQLEGLPSLHLAEIISSRDKEHIRLARSVIAEFHQILEEILDEVVPTNLGVKPGDLVLVIMGVEIAYALWGYLLNDSELHQRIQEELIPFLMKCISGRELSTDTR